MSYRGKRAMDLVLVGVSAPAWLPLLALLALVVRRNLGRPVLFRQMRPGRDALPFELLKFRTMTDARGPNGLLLPDADRLTPFGAWLRSTSLDELPELLNVIRGEMSLVGPRPLLTEYLPRYSAAHRRRHAIRPGLTGLAQVSGRNTLSWSDRFDLDVVYVDRCSFTLDLQILFRTIKPVFARTGVTSGGTATMQEFISYEQPGDDQHSC